MDWPTRDGTGIRDYVHVWDLAIAHVEMLRRFDAVLPAGGPVRYDVLNLGTGAGTTVRELLAAFESVCGAPLPAREVSRRPGDAVGVYTRTGKVRRILGWQAAHTLEEGVRDSLRWSEARDDILG